MWTGFAGPLEVEADVDGVAGALDPLDPLDPADPADPLDPADVVPTVPVLTEPLPPEELEEHAVNPSAATAARQPSRARERRRDEADVKGT
jgi:hypothetical protein